MDKKLTILFGTETGNAEMLAHDAATAAKSNGFAAEVRGMDEISVEELYNVHRLLIYCSTLGDGEQPDNAQDLFDAVSDCPPSALTGLNLSLIHI